MSSGFSFLVVLPDAIRLLLIPAPHCPVPASSASGLLSLLAPPCPVCATSAGAFLSVSISAGYYPALSFFVFRRIIRLFLLRIPPDVIRLLPIPLHVVLCPRVPRAVCYRFCPSLSCVPHLRWCVFLLPPVLFSSPKPLQKVYYILIYNIVFFA